jgi:hypothetical protein
LKAGQGGFTSQKSFEKHMKKDFFKFLRSKINKIEIIMINLRFKNQKHTAKNKKACAGKNHFFQNFEILNLRTKTIIVRNHICQKLKKILNTKKHENCFEKYLKKDV